MKKLLGILILGLMLSSNVLSQTLTEQEKADKELDLAQIWASYNYCWFNVEKKMTDFALNIIDNKKKLGGFERYETGYWRRLTDKVVKKFPIFDYSKCETEPASKKAEAWAKKNLWFGVNMEMTEYAMQIHSRLASREVDTESDEYYREIDNQMRLKFPDYNWE